MRERVLSKWDIVRVIRLLLGVAAIVQGLLNAEWLLVVAGVAVAGMALLNAGCCGAAGCSVPAKTGKQKNTEVL